MQGEGSRVNQNYWSDLARMYPRLRQMQGRNDQPQARGYYQKENWGEIGGGTPCHAAFVAL
jgi:hypothetical protein